MVTGLEVFYNRVKNLFDSLDKPGKPRLKERADNVVDNIVVKGLSAEDVDKVIELLGPAERDMVRRLLLKAQGMIIGKDGFSDLGEEYVKEGEEEEMSSPNDEYSVKVEDLLKRGLIRRIEYRQSGVYISISDPREIKIDENGARVLNLAEGESIQELRIKIGYNPPRDPYKTASDKDVVHKSALGGAVTIGVELQRVEKAEEEGGRIKWTPLYGFEVKLTGDSKNDPEITGLIYTKHEEV